MGFWGALPGGERALTPPEVDAARRRAENAVESFRGFGGGGDDDGDVKEVNEVGLYKLTCSRPITRKCMVGTLGSYIKWFLVSQAFAFKRNVYGYSSALHALEEAATTHRAAVSFAGLGLSVPVLRSSRAGREVRINRSTYQVKPFYLSSETVLPINRNRSIYQVKPFYLSSETVLPFKRNVYRYKPAAAARGRRCSKAGAGRWWWSWWGRTYKPFCLSSETVLPIKWNRSTHQVKPFYPSSETVLPIKWNRSTYQTVLPFNRNLYRYIMRSLAVGGPAAANRARLRLSPLHVSLTPSIVAALPLLAAAAQR
jgi:hypothetical protein